MQNTDHEVYKDDELDNAWADYVASLHKPSQSLHDEIKRRIQDRERKTLIDLQQHIRGLSQARIELESAADIGSVEESSSCSSEAEESEFESDAETDTGTVKILATPTSTRLSSRPKLVAAAKSEPAQPSTPIKDALDAHPPQHRRNRSNQALLRSPLYQKHRTATMVCLTSLKDVSDDSYDSSSRSNSNSDGDGDTDSDSGSDGDTNNMQSKTILGSPSEKDIIDKDCNDSDSAEHMTLSANYSHDSADSTSEESLNVSGFVPLGHDGDGDVYNTRSRRHYQVESMDSVLSEGQFEHELQELKEELDQFKRRQLSHALNIEENAIGMEADELKECTLEAIDSHQNIQEEQQACSHAYGRRSVPAPALLQLANDDSQPRKLDPYSLEFAGFDPDDYEWHDNIPDGGCIDDDEMSLRDRRIQCLVVMAIENSFCSIADLTYDENELLLLHQESLRF